MLSECADQSTIDVVNGDAEGCDDHILGHSCDERVSLIPSYGWGSIDRWKIHV